MQMRAIEAIEAWDMEAPKSDVELLPVLSGVNGAAALLERVADQVDVVGGELSSLLASADIFGLVERHLQVFQPVVDEQLAIQELRNAFGEPVEDKEMILQAYLDLANDEVNDRKQTRSEATKMREAVNQKIDEVLYLFSSVLLARMAELQAEIEDREKVLDGAETIASQNATELAPLLAVKRRPLDTRVVELTKQRDTLGDALSGVRHVLGGMRAGVEYRIAPYATQAVGPTDLIARAA